MTDRHSHAEAIVQNKDKDQHLNWSDVASEVTKDLKQNGLLDQSDSAAQSSVYGQDYLNLYTWNAAHSAGGNSSDS